MTGPDKERAAVVAYLRECQAMYERWERSKGGDQEAYKHCAIACKLAANEIEKGAHWLTEDLKRRYV